MSEPLRGRALALAALDHIEKHPEEWKQGSWRCGSACCFAGHVAMLAGCEWSNHNAYSSLVRMPNGATTHVKYAAVDLLDIEMIEYEDEDEDYTDDFHPLFEGLNSAADLRRLVDKYLPEQAYDAMQWEKDGRP